MNEPVTSVLMSCYNDERYIRSSLSSILKEPKDDLELLLIDDGSTDHTSTIIHLLAHPNLKIFRNERRLGLATNLNRLAAMGSGRYFARFDSDDECLPNRLTKQTHFLETHPEVGVIGSQAILIDEQGKRVGTYKTFSRHLLIKWRCLFANPMIHPSVMLRKEILLANPYNETYPNSQDYELWSRLLFEKGVIFANLPEPLIRYRIHPASTTKQRTLEQKRLPIETSIRNIKRYLALSVEDESLFRSYRLQEKLTPKELRQIAKLFSSIAEAFKKKEKPKLRDAASISLNLLKMDYSLLKFWIKQHLKS